MQETFSDVCKATTKDVFKTFASILVGYVLVSLLGRCGPRCLPRFVIWYMWCFSVSFRGITGLVDLRDPYEFERTYEISRKIVSNCFFKDIQIENEPTELPKHCFVVANHPNVYFDIFKNMFLKQKCIYVLRAGYDNGILSGITKWGMNELRPHDMIFQIPKSGGYDAMDNFIQEKVRNNQECRIFILPEGRYSDYNFKLNKDIKSTCFKLAKKHNFPLVPFLIDPSSHHNHSLNVDLLRMTYLRAIEPSNFETWRELKLHVVNVINDYLVDCYIRRFGKA